MESSKSHIHLNPPQEFVINSGILVTGFNCILQMPTGSGKTWLAQHAIDHVLKQGYRAIYLTPLRALASEIAESWQTRFPEIEIGVFTGDYGDSQKPYPVPFKNAQIMIMTPERLDACTRAWRAHWHWIPEVDLVVADEFHLLGDSNRGARLEGAILRLRRLNPFARIVGLSATLGNRGELADWLDGVEFGSDWRPIPIDWRIVLFRKATEKPDLLAEEVHQNVCNGGKSLVFVQSRRRAEDLSTMLATCGLRSRHHHAGLAHAQRAKVERGFRQSDTDVLVATATLEMGLNLPVRQVVLYDLQFFDGTGYQALPVNNVWQRVGRAGRPGLDEYGEGVLLAPAWDKSCRRYPSAPFDPVKSAIASKRHLAEQIVAEVHSGMSRTQPQLSRAFSGSLAAHQGNLPDIDTCLEEMVSAEMVVEDNECESDETEVRYRATPLGHIAARHMLLPETVQGFTRELSGSSTAHVYDLLVACAAAPDCEPVIPIDFEEIPGLAENMTRIVSPNTRKKIAREEDRPRCSGKRLLAALKMAFILHSWSTTSDLDRIGNLFNCYSFEV